MFKVSTIVTTNLNSILSPLNSNLEDPQFLFQTSQNTLFQPLKNPQKFLLQHSKIPILNPEKAPYFGSQKHLFQITKNPISTPQKPPLTPCFKPQKLYFNSPSPLPSPPRPQTLF
jgi:hypothetical protein